MGFFSVADLDGIRADPSSIVDLYATEGADFIAALNMPGLSDHAYMAAFATALAYDLAPYGDEPYTFDITALANASSLACDRYVTLAWGLADLLGVLDTDGTAVGWDGGVVGNHSQLLFNDGQTQLLLDPTIGLIVNGATYNGLISGTNYTNIASFYWRDDITSFNAEVISAVENGSYQVWDTTYYVPSFSEWENNLIGHVGVTVDDGDGNETIVGWILDDGITAGAGNDWVYGNDGNDILDGGAGVDTAVFRSSVTDNTVSYNSDRSVTVTGPEGTDTLDNFEILQFDEQKVDLAIDTIVQADMDSFSWDSMIAHTDYSGNTIDVTYYYDDGSSWLYQYDTLSQFNWSRLQTRTDTDGNVVSIYYDEDDGSHVLYNYDPTNLETWSRITTYMTPDGSKASIILYDEDDGTHVTYEYDVNSTGAWHDIVTYYTSNYAVLSHLYNQDDGTHVLYQYDVNGAYAWSVLQTNYDESFHRTSEVLTNDNGTHALLQFNASDQLISTQNYDASWNLIA
ncbi:hypothetical protein ABIF33_004791 [Bradyrhizobium elkanii]